MKTFVFIKASFYLDSSAIGLCVRENVKSVKICNQFFSFASFNCFTTTILTRPP